MKTAPIPPPDTQARVAVVILNWRAAADTIACARSVAGLAHDSLDIIVCDNDSGDGSADTIASEMASMLPELNAARESEGRHGWTMARIDPDRPAPPLPPGKGRLWIAQTGRNGGYAFGNNAGIKLALIDPTVGFVWILNNDTLVSRDALTALLARMARDERIGICGAKVLYLERPDTVQTLGGGRFLAMPGRCEQVGEGLPAAAPVDEAAIEATLSYVNGAAALVRRSLIEQVGPMDEGYFLYWEEVDWAVRARAHGFRIGMSADAIVHHRVGGVTGSSDHGLSSLGSLYWMTRSRIRFLRRHRPRSLPFAMLHIARGVMREWRAGRPQRARTMIRAALGRGPAR